MLKQHIGIKTECCHKIDPIERRLEKCWNRWGHDKSIIVLNKYITIIGKLKVYKNISHLIRIIFLLIQRLIFLQCKCTYLIMISNVNHKLQQSSTQKNASWGNVLDLSNVQYVALEYWLCTVTFRITGTRQFGWVLIQNENIDVRMKNTDAKDIIC